MKNNFWVALWIFKDPRVIMFQGLKWLKCPSNVEKFWKLFMSLKIPYDKHFVCICFFDLSHSGPLPTTDFFQKLWGFMKLTIK